MRAEPAPAVGSSTDLTLRLTDAAGGAITPNRLAVVHEHKLHVMIIDEGLEDYVHLHPQANPDGTFSLSFTPRLARPYRIWADFRLAGGDAHTSHADHGASITAAADLAIAAEQPATPLTAIEQFEAVAEGLRLTLAPDAPSRVGREAVLRLNVAETNGAPFAGLEPLMGAYAHLVAFDAGATTLVHAHPDGPEPSSASARGGPDLVFRLTPTRAGPLRMFLQIKRDGREIGAVFAVVVAE